MKHLIFPRQAGGFRGLVLFVFVLAGCIFATSEVRAINRTWNGSDNGNWSDPDNWGPTGVPQNGDTLIFPVLTGIGTEKSMVNDLANLRLELITFTGSGYILTGNPLTLNQGITDNHLTTGLNRVSCALQFTSGGGRFNTLNTGQLEITGTVTLANNQDLIVTALITNLTVSGAIQGTGGLVKRGEGALYLRGTAANTYTGPTIIEGGAVHLAKTSAARAISPNVLIEGGFFEGGLSSLADNLPGQYPPELSVVITNNGVWRITNGATVTNLVLADGGSIEGTGLLNLQCDVKAIRETFPIHNHSRIDCSIFLGAQTRTFLITARAVIAELSVAGQIIGPGPGANSPGIIKSGSGTLILEAANIYFGPTLVRDGTLLVKNGGALGGSGPGAETKVEQFARLKFSGFTMTVPEPLVMEDGLLIFHGTITLTGPMTLGDRCVILGDDELALLEIRSVISGPGDLTVQGGTVRLSGATPNTFGSATSTVFVQIGILELAKPNNVTALPARVVLDSGAVLRNLQDGGVSDLSLRQGSSWLLNGHSVAPTALEFLGAGIVDTQGGQLHLTNPGANQLHAGTGFGLPNYTAQIFGQVACLAATNDITIEEGPTLNIRAQITGGGVIRKLGSGTLGFYGNNSFTGPVVTEAGQLHIGSATALGTRTAGTIIREGATLSLGAGAGFLGEPLTLAGPGSQRTNGALFTVSDIFITNNAVLTGPTTIRTDGTNSRIQILGVISGTGPLTKVGKGVFGFRGNTHNTYSGDTFAHEGTLRLTKASGIASVPGHLIVGVGGSGIVPLATAEQGASFTIIGSVTVNRGGLWDLNGQSEGWGIAELQGRPPLTLNDGGNVQTGAGIFFLPVGGDVVVNSGNSGGSFISGRIGLDPGPHRFSVGPALSVLGGPGLDVTADVVSVSGISGITKVGPATMRLAGSNTFNGDLIINEGRLLAANSLAFGSSASGTIVNSNASLALAGQVFLEAERLTLNSGARPALDAVAGFNGWGGIIQLSRDAHVKVTDPAGVLSFTGPVIGAGGLTKLGAGGLNLGGVGANSYAGLTVISSGIVEVNKPANVLGVGGDAIIGDNANPPTNATLRAAIGHLRPTANVTVNRSGLFDIFNSPNPGLGIRTMPGAGRVNITSGSALTISNDVSFEFSGALTGAGALNKRGIATLHLSGDSPAYTGSATVFDGTSKVDGRIPNSPITVKTDSNLRGGGVVGNVTAFETGSLISVDSGSPGTLGGDLEVGALTMVAGGVSDGVVGLAFYGPSPTGGNDSIVARGAVNINSTRLSIGFGYPAREGDVMTLIKKNSAGPIIGSFTGWPEGIVRKLNDVTVRATYLGGDGNDFTLTVTNTAMGFSSYRLAEGNGNQTVEPDECNLLFLSLANHRTNALRITNAVLRAVSAGFSLTPTEHPTDRVLVTIASAAYPTIPAGATRENLTPFQFRTTPILPCGNPVTFELVVGVAGEGVFAIIFTPVSGVDCTRPTGGCESCVVVHGQFTADAVASTRRLLFAGAPSICYPVKPCPGVVEADDLPPMRQVVHSFTNSATNEICVTAQLNFECPNAPTNALGVAAYLGEFRINQPCSNYLGDGGAGGPPYPPFSFRVPARTNFLIVVTARETNLVCDSYALELFGLPCPPPTPAIAKDAVTGNIRISWSSAYPDFRLQSVNALSGPEPFPFTDLATPPKLLSGQYTVTNVPDSGQKFYRLMKP